MYQIQRNAVVRKICKDLRLGEKSPFIGRIVLLVTVAAICTLPALAQEAPMGTGVLWRNLEVRPLTCAFSPDGSRLGCGSWGNGAVENIAILDAKEGKVLRSFGKKEFGQRQPELLAWSPNGKKLAVATNYNPQTETGERGVIYSVESGAVIRVLNLDDAGRVSDLTFSSDGNEIAAIAIPQVYRWGIEGDASVDIITLEMEGYGGEAVAFAPRAGQLVTGREKVILWDAKTGKRIKVIEEEASEETAGIFVDFAFSPDGKLLAGTTKNLNTTVWNIATGKEQFAVKMNPEPELTSRQRSKSSMHFVNSKLLAWYVPALGRVKLTNVPSGKEQLVIDAPKVGSGDTGMTWAGDRFAFASMQRSPAIVRILCRGTITCGKGESLTPEKLAEMLPASAAGLERAMADSRWGEVGPTVEAIYGNMQKGMEMEISITDKAEIEKLRQEWEARSNQEGMFEKDHNGYTVYGGGDEKGRGMVLLLDNATVMIEGNVEMEQMLGAFDALSLKEIEELAGGNE